MAIKNFFKKNDPAIWLEYIEYADRLFNPNQQNIWNNPFTFLSVFGQGQSLLRSDVISIPASSFYANWLSDHPEEKEGLKGKKLKVTLKKILSLDGPKRNIQEVLKGICHLYKDQHPIVLTIPSPQAWLMEAARLTDNRLEEMDESLVDAASMYLADWLRQFADAGLDSIVIAESHDITHCQDEAGTLLQPIINVARHYQWEIGYWGTNETMTPPPFADYYICSQRRTGNSFFFIKETWWNKPYEEGLSPETGMVFGAIPKDAVPEHVLMKLQELRMAAKSS